jgi:hypothetical protein
MLCGSMYVADGLRLGGSMTLRVWLGSGLGGISLMLLKYLILLFSGPSGKLEMNCVVRGGAGPE